MRVFDAFTDFKKNILDKRHRLGFQDWTVVQVQELTEEEKQSIKSVDTNARTICFVSIVHTTSKRHETVLIRDDTLTADDIKQTCLNSYLEDVDKRVVGVNPSQMEGFFEYESWSKFKDDWLVRDGKPLFPYVAPLLFDLPTDIEYLSWQKEGKAKLPYRRLIVTLYAYSKDAYYSMFVKDATEEDIQHYLLLLKAQKGLAAAWK